jgi:N-acetylgalactosamine kinase
MKFGSRGYIAHIGFLPFSTSGTYKFPENCKLIVANSMVKAQKTTNARDTFNQRIASYEFGLMMLKEKFPRYSHKIQYLRDVNPENLGINPSEIYNMLMELPEKITPAELFDLLPAEYQPRIKQIMESHNAPGYYIIRPVILYGIAECERAKKCVRLLDSGLLNEFGALMNISHNGDRVVSYDGQLKLKDYDWGVSDSYLEKLISDLKSEDPERVLNAQIERQPGGYACSTTETDLMVDIAKNVPNVIGAQLSGAGLGGCVMILAMEKAVPSLINELNSKYYEPKGLNPAITICTAVNGSSVLSF